MCNLCSAIEAVVYMRKHRTHSLGSRQMVTLRAKISPSFVIFAGGCFQIVMLALATQSSVGVVKLKRSQRGKLMRRMHEVSSANSLLLAFFLDA